METIPGTTIIDRGLGCNQYLFHDDRLRLMAWLHIPGIQHPIYAEIDEADGETRTIAATIPGRWYRKEIPFRWIDCVSLIQNGSTLHTFGRPPAEKVPEWIRFYEEVD